MAKAAPVRQIFEHLGAAALGRVLDDLLDPGQLVQLANACGLRYPGMRTQTQARERLVADLVGKAEKTQSSRKTILRVLAKVSAHAAAAPTLPPCEHCERRPATARVTQLQADGTYHHQLLCEVCAHREGG